MIQKIAVHILTEAVKFGAHDVYFLPYRGKYQCFFRSNLTKVKQEILEFDQAIALMTHFKFVAGMNVGENRRVQLGACWYEIDGKKQRLRLSTVGDFLGRESLVIRMLKSDETALKFWSNLTEIVPKRGLYLFSGPVGSGKTSLMYDLATRYFENEQVITIEDPVELVNDDFAQLQVNEAIGNDYESLIKLSLRHHPDLLIVGEIRDEKTAKAVLRASLVGYTVFSTIHAKSISGAYARFLDLGVKKEELNQALQGIFYQRLLSGKGLVDFTEKNFEKHSPEKWNGWLGKLAADGYLTARQAQTEKITIDQTSQADSAHE